MNISSEIKTRLLQGFTSIKPLKHIHARLLRSNLLHDCYLCNILLRSSFNFNKNTHYSQLLFSHIQQPNEYVWNTLIRGLVSHDHFHQSINRFHSMRQLGFLPNHFTFPFVLKACTRVLDLRLGVELHTIMVKVGYDWDVFVKTGLVCLYAKCGRLDDACKVFDEMPEKNAASWTAVISGYIESDRFTEALDVFKKLLEMNLRPDSFTLVRILSACSRLGDLRTAEWVDSCVTGLGMGKNIFVGTAFVDTYAKCGSMTKALATFDQMREKDAVTWGAMIQGYVSNGEPKEALDMFYRMKNDNIKPDCYTIVGVLSACSSLGALELGEWARTLVDKNEFLYNPIVGTSLIDMYAKCGKMGSAWRVFKEMKEKDLIVWNAVITGLGMTGQTKVLFGLLGQLEKLGIHPDGKTFIGILCGCTHAGLVNDGKRYFNNMTRVFSLTPSIEHYGCMVDLLGRAGLLDEAHLLIKSMPMEPNAIVWGALLSGCRLHRDTQLAEYVLKKLIELEPWNSGNYVLLSNIFSANKNWEDAENIRSAMSHRSIRKIPGCCWIEVKGVVHEFLVGDKSHPMQEQIYAKLSELTMGLKQMGYVPTTEFVLFDVEDEEKEHFLGCHSEKLAIAFGLISTKPGDVIRVVKNIRVCGDCHMAIKLFSKITGREIVLRDNNRFHSFIDGSCSCGDYW
ncbi:putative tetratricopeptide-like helical domain superfamily, DYW domain-containing protein [Helianthus annuus]|uniref:Putative pentatricopeptide repeat (PPR) superfamily protein n=1 Tax=Helianthus annuus TaxID=4232 RepID=A0A251RY04_HELAN|nr:putative pentatricopeptide repeat-containing protein At3g08820 [Helianthus annuus]KAF5759570.1 putative tetratricopeptide-like helical domain superfamily, DYW domain-containing protein [Helianthus annuus]KAJ0437761.1 putative tetratricopeptide-like helical domain superfamily, DYW domain-containing protein [Helianthus annuus]KAJ0460082.1 putative tetratricopeptide-like helical domain superfamily, DYW domain-containing protein [Helianthus annuus]